MIAQVSDFLKPYRRGFLLPMACWLWSPAAAQSFTTKPTDGERLDYTVTYEWGPFYLEVGDVSFTTASGVQRKSTLEFEGWGAS